MKKLLFLVMMLGLLVGISHANVLLNNAGDTWVREDDPTSNRNGNDQINARTDIDADDNDVILLKFDLTEQPVASSGNTLNLVWQRDDSSTSNQLSLYGLLETDPDETTWSESTVVYNDAPGLIPDGQDPTAETGASHTWDDVRDLDTANLTLLVDSQAYGPQVTDEVYTFSGAALDAFLNADTNGYVTFLIVRANESTSGNQARFQVKEVGTGAYLDIPLETPPQICPGVGIPYSTYADVSCRTDSDYPDTNRTDNHKLSIEVDIANDQSAKSWIKFDISDLNLDPNSIKEATLRLTLLESEAQSETFDVSAVNDSCLDNITWGETDITWNNAPANDTESWENPDLTKATKMGTITLGTEIGVGAQHYVDVKQALQSDTDGIVQFILHNSTALIQIATHDHGGEADWPQLNILLYPEGADNPNPCPGDTVGTDLAELSWTNPDPNDGTSPITCVVYLGTDPNRPNMDEYVIPTDDPTSVTINEDNFPISYDAVNGGLYNNTTYYWFVDCYDPSHGLEPILGLQWNFIVNDNEPPVVDAGTDDAVWLGMSSTPGQEEYTLNGTVTDDGLPEDPGTFTILWTQEDNGAPSVAIDPNNIEDPTVTFTERGDYLFTLTADDGQEGGLGISSDSVRIVVGDTPCDASHIDGGTIDNPAPYDPGDYNQDCIVDMTDFAELVAANWLDCTDTLDNCGN